MRASRRSMRCASSSNCIVTQSAEPINPAHGGQSLPPDTLRILSPRTPRMRTIYVDADACPVKGEIYKVARRYEMQVKVVANAPLRVPADPLVELVLCPGFGGVDDW